QVIATFFSASTFAAASRALIFFSFPSAAGLAAFPFLPVLVFEPVFVAFFVLVAVMAFSSVAKRWLPSSGGGCHPPRRPRERGRFGFQSLTGTVTTRPRRSHRYAKDTFAVSSHSASCRRTTRL